MTKPNQTHQIGVSGRQKQERGDPHCSKTLKSQFLAIGGSNHNQNEIQAYNCVPHRKRIKRYVKFYENSLLEILMNLSKSEILLMHDSN